MEFHPVVLAGGNGSRLWPMSRAQQPKPFLRLDGPHTLLQATLLRAADLSGARPPLIIGNEAHRFLLREQCREVGIAPAAIWLEPEGRGTASAIALAALQLAAHDPHALMLVLPADHVIRGTACLAQAVGDALIAAQAGHLASFGVAPRWPATGYGYLETAAALDLPEAQHPVYALAGFVEKPARALAETLVLRNHAWNSGLFAFSAGRFLEELAALRPDLLAAVRHAWAAHAPDGDFRRPAGTDFLACPAASVDHAVMQRTQRGAVVPLRCEWHDIGSWDALWQLADKDANGNATVGAALAVGAHNCYVRAESRLVAAIGLRDIALVETPDAVLAVQRDQAQAVGELAARLAAHGPIEHVRTHRPWGWYETIDAGTRFLAKRLMVKPGGKLSLQLHRHRAEHWVVVSGTAKVTLDGRELLLTEDQSTYIPVGRPHRLENPAAAELHLIEVQTGDYLGEDDIVRLAD